MDCKLILQDIKETYLELLHNNLVGIYVHGSIAFNCFNWEKSDIDFIAVVRETIQDDIKNEIIKETLRINKNAPQKGLEMSIVLKEYCMNFKYPTPFDLHFSNMHIDWYKNSPQEYCQKMNGVDKDLAAHFTVTKKAGIVLYGEPINNVFGEVPKEYYFDSIKHDIQNAKNEVDNNPIYILLNLCRVLAYKKDCLILSKEQGGNWGLDKLDYKYNYLIRTALDCYTSDKIITIDNDLALEFCEYMLKQIYE